MLGKFENIWTKDKSYFQIIPPGMDGTRYTICKNIYIKTDKYTLGFKVLDDNGYFIIGGDLDDKKTFIYLKDHIIRKLNYAGSHNIDSIIYKKKVINKADIFERYFVSYFSVNNIELIVRNNLKITLEKLFLNYGESLPLYKDDNGGYINLGNKVIDIANTIYYINGYKQDGLENYHYMPVNVEVNIKMNRKYKKKLYGEI